MNPLIEKFWRECKCGDDADYLCTDCAEKAVAAERERCACIVDAMEVVVEDFGVREYTAAAIRKGS